MVGQLNFSALFRVFARLRFSKLRLGSIDNAFPPCFNMSKHGSPRKAKKYTVNEVSAREDGTGLFI